MLLLHLMQWLETGTVLSGLCAGGIVYVYGGLSEQPSNGIQASDVIFQGKRVEGLALRQDKQAICTEIQLSNRSRWPRPYVPIRPDFLQGQYVRWQDPSPPY